MEAKRLVLNARKLLYLFIKITNLIKMYLFIKITLFIQGDVSIINLCDFESEVVYIGAQLIYSVVGIVS